MTARGGRQANDTATGGPAPRVTLQTIADRVGCSRTTASNAWSRPDQLTPELRERILAVARDLGYAGPNAAARSLRRGRSDAIGVLFTEALTYAVSDPAAIFFLQGVAESLESGGISLLLLPTPVDRAVDPESVLAAIVDGFIAYSVPASDPRLAAVHERGLPTVIVDQPEADWAALVRIDDRAGARAVAEHLVRLGHRRVGAITFRLHSDNYHGPADRARQQSATYVISRERLAGWAEAFAAAGVDWDGVPVIECWPTSQEAGYRAAAELLDRPDRPTAIVAGADQLALGALRAAQERGLRVPHDLSIVGFDDIPAAAHIGPGLTTVRQPLRDKGREAGRLIQQGWSAGAPPRVVLPTELVVRGSSGPAPG